jgi:NhaP-type Na+/H+ or K+/H+ antiporter
VAPPDAVAATTLDRRVGMPRRIVTILEGERTRCSTPRWRTVQFLLENAVFLLIGLLMKSLLEDVADSDLSTGRIVLICVAVLLATILARVV